MISEKSKQIISSVSEEWKVPTAALNSIHRAGLMDAKDIFFCECGTDVYRDEQNCPECNNVNTKYRKPNTDDAVWITSDELYNLNGFGSEEECNKQFL